MARVDGIYELYAALREQRAPPMRWLVEWSEGGTREPVQAAWDACADRPVIMARILELARHPAARHAMSIAFDVGLINPESLRVVTARIREVVPKPPTLRDLLSRR